MKTRLVWLGLLALVLPACGGTKPGGGGAKVGAPLAFEDAKLLIEHNATDEDTGFQGFVDGDAWRDLRVVGPDGKVVLHITAEGSLQKNRGLTELASRPRSPPTPKCPLPTCCRSCRRAPIRSRGGRRTGRPSRKRRR